MSADALAGWSVGRTVCKGVADSLSLAHELCDPGKDERLEFGLACNSEDLPEPERSRQWNVRERIWLRRLIELNHWPALFVCGPNHIERLERLLTAERIEVVVAAKRWRLSE